MLQANQGEINTIMNSGSYAAIARRKKAMVRDFAGIQMSTSRCATHKWSLPSLTV